MRNRNPETADTMFDLWCIMTLISAVLIVDWGVREHHAATTKPHFQTVQELRMTR